MLCRQCVFYQRFWPNNTPTLQVPPELLLLLTVWFWWDKYDLQIDTVYFYQNELMKNIAKCKMDEFDYKIIYWENEKVSSVSMR